MGAAATESFLEPSSLIPPHPRVGPGACYRPPALKMGKHSGDIAESVPGKQRPEWHPGCQALRPIASFLFLLENTALLLQLNMFSQKPLRYIFFYL